MPSSPLKTGKLRHKGSKQAAQVVTARERTGIQAVWHQVPPAQPHCHIAPHQDLHLGRHGGRESGPQGFPGLHPRPVRLLPGSLRHPPPPEQCSPPRLLQTVSLTSRCFLPSQWQTQQGKQACPIPRERTAESRAPTSPAPREPGQPERAS